MKEGMKTKRTRAIQNVPADAPGQGRMLIDSDTSRAITGVRFALMVLVVFIHNVVTEVNFSDGVVTLDVPPAVDAVRRLISHVLGRCAVPLFFVISGWLAWQKEESYPALVKKKTRTLLAPYLVWNAAAALAFFLCQQLAALRPFFATIIISELDGKGWLGLFIGRDVEGAGAADSQMHPLVYQFWFLRDLFLCSLLIPLLKKAVQTIPLFTFFGVFLLLQSGLLYAGIRTALFWFTLGLFAARYGLRYAALERIRFADAGLFFALTTALDFLFYFLKADALATWNLIGILSGGILLLKISGAVCRNERVFAALKWLAGFSFWLYAAHDPFLMTPIKKLWVHWLPVEGYWMLLEYFGGAALCVGIALAAGVLVKKIAPGVFAFVTGSRSVC